MRFLFKIDLSGNPVVSPSVNFSIFNSVLNSSKRIIGDNFEFHGVHYANHHPSINEYFINHPLYENEEYIMIVAGNVFYRIHNVQNCKYIPKGNNLLDILLIHGNEHYKHIKGNYYILIYKKSTQNLTVFASPFFLTPAYLYIDNSILLFSNHMEFITAQIDSPKLNQNALVEFSLFDHTIDRSTVIEGIFQIPGGHKVTLNEDNELQFELIYDLAQWDTKKLKPKKESLSKLNSILKEHLQYYVDSTDRFNLALTGGFDGRLNLALIPEADHFKMNTYSYGKPGSNQLSIPLKIASKLKFKYRSISLDKDFEKLYAQLGYNSIFLTSGVTGFNRAIYPYAYSKIASYSKSCILGQCDMIRPLYKQSAGAIFNAFSKYAILYNSYSTFLSEYRKLRKTAFINKEFLTDELADEIYSKIQELYVTPYPHLSNKEQYYFFLYKESIMKYWHTECHLVNLFVDDFISFSDLDYIEELHHSKYCGYYKGIFAKNQFQRKRVHDLYIELTRKNKKKLNNFQNDRYVKPKYLNYYLLGLLLGGVGKKFAKLRHKIIGNDTFDSVRWKQPFYKEYEELIASKSTIFNVNNILNQTSYDDDNEYRKDRHVSLKIWLQEVLK